MWAAPALYQALRIAITDAVATRPGTDPDRASYQIATQTAQAMVIQARNILTAPATSPAASASRSWPACTRHASPPCGRRLKSPLSRRNKHPAGKPRTCQKIATTTHTVTRHRHTAGNT